MSEKTQKSEKLKNLEQKRDHQVTRVFWMMIEIALIFGIPAGAGVVLIKTLDLSGIFIPIIFGPALLLSWVLVVFRYRTIKKKLESLDQEIRKVREEEGVIPQEEITEEEYKEKHQ